MGISTSAESQGILTPDGLAVALQQCLSNTLHAHAISDTYKHAKNKLCRRHDLHASNSS